MWSAKGMDPETAEHPRAAPATVPARARKRTRTALARSILRQVRAHPANAAAPNRAVVRTCVWQIRKRLTRRPIRRRAYGLDLTFPHRSGSLSNLVYFGECFEWENINFLRRYLRPGDTVVDGGANVGMFTYAAAEAVAPDGHVHVFEPLRGPRKPSSRTSSATGSARASPSTPSPSRTARERCASRRIST